MARAAGKATKKKAPKKRNKRRPTSGAKTKHRSPSPDWSEEGCGPITRLIIYDGWGGVFDNPLMYALSPLGDAGPAEAKFLPELVALLLRTIQYFAINADPCGRDAVFPSREALKLFLANYRCSDGSRLKPHMINALETICLSLRLGKGGRPCKKSRPSPLDELREGRARIASAVNMRITLRPLVDDGFGPAEALPASENR